METITRPIAEEIAAEAHLMLQRGVDALHTELEDAVNEHQAAERTVVRAQNNIHSVTVRLAEAKRVTAKLGALVPSLRDWSANKQLEFPGLEPADCLHQWTVREDSEDESAEKRVYCIKCRALLWQLWTLTQVGPTPAADPDDAGLPKCRHERFCAAPDGSRCVECGRTPPEAAQHAYEQTSTFPTWEQLTEQEQDRLIEPYVRVAAAAGIPIGEAPLSQDEAAGVAEVARGPIAQAVAKAKANRSGGRPRKSSAA